MSWLNIHNPAITLSHVKFAVFYLNRSLLKVNYCLFTEYILTSARNWTCATKLRSLLWGIKQNFKNKKTEGFMAKQLRQTRTHCCGTHSSQQHEDVLQQSDFPSISSHATEHLQQLMEQRSQCLREALSGTCTWCTEQRAEAEETALGHGYATCVFPPEAVTYIYKLKTTSSNELQAQTQRITNSKKIKCGLQLRVI